MPNTSFDDYIDKKIKVKPKLKEELEKVDRAVETAYQIYILRKEKGLTQSQLAKKIGVSQSNIARIENADYKHNSRTTLDKVAKGLGAKLCIFISPPGQVDRLLHVYNSLPTLQYFQYADTGVKYYISGLNATHLVNAITLKTYFKNRQVKISTETIRYVEGVDKYFIENINYL